MTQDEITRAAGELVAEMFASIPKDSVAMSIVSADHYPRDKSNRFLDKLLIAEAARDPEKYTDLRESLSEDQRWKLDHVVDRLNWGDTVNHPSEPEGLGVNVKGEVGDVRWREYAEKKQARDGWEERDADRAARRDSLRKYTREVRGTKAAEKLDKELETVHDADDLTTKDIRDRVDAALGEYSTHLDGIESQLEDVGATDAESRSVARTRHAANVSIAEKVAMYANQHRRASKDGATKEDKDRLCELFDKLTDRVRAARRKLSDLLEAVVEGAYQRAEAECVADPEPETPEEPTENNAQDAPGIFA